MQEMTIKELAKKYKKSTSYFNTILCRPEFNQFLTKVTQKGGSKFIYKDCANFHKMLIFFMERKYR